MGCRCLGFVAGVLAGVFGLGAGAQDSSQREDFEVDGRKAFVIAPAAEDQAEDQEQGQAEGGKPWVWYAPTFINRHPGKDEQWMIERLHARGIAIAGIEVGESYGSPQGRAHFQALYEEMTERRGYSKKPVLLARSRGGLMLYNWAAEHPDCVAGVAGIYPVCNLRSYPGLKRAAPAYGMSPDQLETQLARHNPIDRLEPLAKAKVPIFHLHGDSDTVVPLEGNSALLAERYTALGGQVEVQVIAGQGHNGWRGWFESEALTDFMIDRALAGAQSVPEEDADPQ